MDIPELMNMCDKLEPGQFFFVSPKDIHSMAHGTFPRRASVTPNNPSMALFLTPRSWHIDEFVNTMTKHLKNKNCLIEINPREIMILKED